MTPSRGQELSKCWPPLPTYLESPPDHCLARRHPEGQADFLFIRTGKEDGDGVAVGELRSPGSESQAAGMGSAAPGLVPRSAAGVQHESPFSSASQALDTSDLGSSPQAVWFHWARPVLLVPRLRPAFSCLLTTKCLFCCCCCCCCENTHYR